MVKIDSVRFGEIVIDGKTYFSDVTVYWDGTIEHREKDIVVGMEEISRVLGRKINILVVGTGIRGSLELTERVRDLLEGMKIKTFELKSADAIELFNSFASQGRRAAAIIRTMG